MEKNEIICINAEEFNHKFTICGMTKNSIIINDTEGNRILVYRRVINKILSSEYPIPCMVVEREFQGKTQLWLATMSTL